MSDTYTKKIEFVVKNAFTTVLDQEVLPNPAAMVMSRGQPYITSTVQITGAWRGVISLSVPVALGEQIAAMMFEDEIDFMDSEDLEDAMGEITNIVSGSFKSTLEGTCHLGLPIVTVGVDYVVRFPGSHVECDVGFECLDECFHVNLIQANDSD